MKSGEIAKRRKTTTNAPPTPQVPPGTTKIKPLVKQVLSKELQLYYEKIVLMVKSHDEELILTVIESLRTDPGLHPLLPYFIQFISDEVVAIANHCNIELGYPKFTKFKDAKLFNENGQIHSVQPLFPYRTLRKPFSFHNDVVTSINASYSNMYCWKAIRLSY